MLLELPAGFRRDEFAAAALERDVRVSSIASFAVGAAGDIEALRLSLVAADNREALRRGLERLRDLLAAGPQSRRAIV
jgi:DNA-binding transcriptional MocR family regulator